MTQVEASAPGKLVLLGEYAVLEGAPALVLAVDRRVRVTLTTLEHDDWEIISPTLGLSARLRVGPGTITWAGAPQAELTWVATLLANVPFAARLPVCRVVLDSDRFHDDHAETRVKLGLGSSAALTVAMVGALHALAGEAAPTLEACAGVHRSIQQGRGSGIDVAASFRGGLSRFELDASRVPRCSALTLPDGVHWCCVFSGQPASTGEMLAGVAAWRQQDPAGYTRHIRELATIAGRGVHAVVRNDVAAFLSSLHDYALALARLGDASGVGIASPAHRAIAALADEHGVVYKSCGAGGGDVGITFAVDDQRLQEFATEAVGAGFPVIALDKDPQGLRIDANA